MKWCLSFAIWITMHGYSFAQSGFHWESANGPTVDAPDLLAVNSNGDILAGRGGVIYRSTTGGLSWQRFPLPKYFGNARQIRTLPSTHIGMITDAGFTIRCEKDGSAYTIVRAGYADWLQTDRRGTIFVHETSGEIIRSRDEGGKWDTVATPAGEIINGFTDDEHSYYVTTRTGIYTSVDEGKTWLRSLNGLANSPYYAIAAGFGGHAWALGYPDRNVFVFTTDYGVHWTNVNGDVDIHYPIYVGRNNEVMLGNGHFFHDSTLQGGGLSNSSGLYAYDSSGQWLGARGGSTNIMYAFGGIPTNWYPFAPLPLSGYQRVFRAFAKILTGDDNSEFALDSLNQWHQLTWTSTHPLAMNYFDHSLLGTSSATELLRSTDSGRSWRDVFPAIPSGKMQIAASSATRFYAATNGIYSTTDSGKSWTQTNDHNVPSPITGLATDSSQNVYAATSNRLFASTDQGNSWQEIALPALAMIVNLQCNKSGAIAFSTTSDTLFRSLDHGTTWSVMAMPDHATINGMALHSSGGIFVASSNQVFYWRSGGVSLINVSDGLDSIGISSLAFDGSEVLYTATSGAGVYRSVGDIAMLSVSQQPVAPMLVVSPNPASRFVDVAMRPEDECVATAYDALGRAFALQTAKSATTLRCNVSGLPNGVYEIRIQSGLTLETAKIEILR